VEIIQDVMNERDALIASLMQATEQDDHNEYQKRAHALKGAALNLHFPALVDITVKAELVGKQLMLTPHAQDFLNIRLPIIQHLQEEYDRLASTLPEYQKKAEEEDDEEGVDMGMDMGLGEEDEGIMEVQDGIHAYEQ